MIKVYFPNQDREIFVNEGETAAAACSRFGKPLDLTCGGKGTCKKCTILIEKNNKKELVLACQERILEETTIYLENKNSNFAAHILTDSLAGELDIEPAVKKIYLEKNLLQTPSYEGDWEHIKKITGLQIEVPSLKLLQKLSNLKPRTNITGITMVLWKNHLIEIEEDDTTADTYGIAIDLGTTSIVAYIYNLTSGIKIGTYSALNGQTSEGADVISRLAASINNPKGTETLQKRVVDTVNSLIDQAVLELGINNDNIYTIVLAGNSAMQHLFLGLYPISLGKAPYTNTITEEVISKAAEIGLMIHPGGIIHFLPLIGGFVGADTTAVLLSLPEEQTPSYKLIIDLGTNGEILLGKDEKWLCTSTAAGPALEGANISYGMRGTDGAIEKVKLTDGHIELKVISGEKAKGICGSGIIDAVAEMLKVGLITQDGRLLTAEKYLASCQPKYRKLAERLAKIDNINVFILVDKELSFSGEQVYISQKDIRAVQLAKSAIYTGCLVLIKEYGLKGIDLAEIQLAGAFGNYINVSNAQYIGLIPNFDNVPIKAIGNAAGAGAINFLLSKAIQHTTSEKLRTVTHMDLATNPNFEKEYLFNTNFGNNASASNLFKATV